MAITLLTADFKGALNEHLSRFVEDEKISLRLFLFAVEQERLRRFWLYDEDDAVSTSRAFTTVCHQYKLFIPTREEAIDLIP